MIVPRKREEVQVQWKNRKGWFSPPESWRGHPHHSQHPREFYLAILLLIVWIFFVVVVDIFTVVHIFG